MFFLWLLATALAQAADDPLMSVLDAELERTMAGWEGRDGAPYFVGYRAVDQVSYTIRARGGALADSSQQSSRSLDVQARVGSPALDSTHPIRSDGFSSRNFYRGVALPLGGDPLALETTIWAHTTDSIRKAQQAFSEVQASQRVRVEEEDTSGDFSAAAVVSDIRPQAALALDVPGWEAALVELSVALDAHEHIYRSEATLHAEQQDRYILTSEGTRIRQPRTWVRVSLQAQTRAEDGMDLQLYRWVDVPQPDALPDTAELTDWAQAVARDVVAMRAAPKQAPYSGPVLLRGAAAGVFVHEVLGHRVEGHRQKREHEGQTFKDLVGTMLLPPEISIVDDPTLAEYAGMPLNGHYAYDEEGVAAQPAVLVEDGVFQGFLMSRLPITAANESNGHGRAADSLQPVARMANTILSTSAPRSEAQLRRMLIAEAKASGQEWGLLVEDLAGGFTMTGRVMPNAYNIRAVTARRVYVDGRPDELVRGIDLVGTPLVALQNVVAAGDDPAVFNGFCGAESGSVPNAAVSPSLLLRSQELQRKEKGSQRPPLLPKPVPGGDS